MTDWAASPHVMDMIVTLTILEAFVLIALRKRLARRVPRSEANVADQGDSPVRIVGIVLMLLPGLFLMLAIRAALDGVAWPWLPAALAAALLAHVADIRQRWFERAATVPRSRTAKANGQPKTTPR